jgi:hypothetical protein
MEYDYYIMKNGASTDEQSLKSGPVIIKIPSSSPIPFTEGNGPYKSLRALKKYSTIFKTVQSTNTKRAQKILEPKNIFTADKLLAIPKGTEFKKEVVQAFMHATIGRIKNGDLTGIHFFDPKRVRILEITNLNDQTKVFEAKFDFYDMKKEKWITKKKPSTFFPMDWDLDDLLMECKYAFEKLNLVALKDENFTSITKSNIEVVIVIRNGKLKSLYPLI